MFARVLHKLKIRNESSVLCESKLSMNMYSVYLNKLKYFFSTNKKLQENEADRTMGMLKINSFERLFSHLICYSI